MAARAPQSSQLGRLLTPAECEALFEGLASRIVPRGELRWSTPLDLLVAVVLSAQTTDRAVNRVTADLWQTCRSVQDYLGLGEERLAERLRTIGLYRNKARSVIGICSQLAARFAGQVPSRREDLESLPGVGPKSASVVLNIAFGQPVIAVDTHVFRVAHRTGLVRARTPAEAERKLLRRVPERFRLEAHHYLILHGRYTCTARGPRCATCGVNSLCTWRGKAVAAKGPSA